MKSLAVDKLHHKKNEITGDWSVKDVEVVVKQLKKINLETHMDKRFDKEQIYS